MSRVLSNEVKQALKDIYYNEWTGKGKEAFAMLERGFRRRGRGCHLSAGPVSVRPSVCVGRSWISGGRRQGDGAVT